MSPEPPFETHFEDFDKPQTDSEKARPSQGALASFKRFIATILGGKPKTEERVETPEQSIEKRRQEIIDRHLDKRSTKMAECYDKMTGLFEKAIPNQKIRRVTMMLLGFVPFVGGALRYMKGYAREHEAMGKAFDTTKMLVKREISFDEAKMLWSDDLKEWFKGKIDTVLGAGRVALDVATVGTLRAGVNVTTGVAKQGAKEGATELKAVASFLNSKHGIVAVREAGPALTAIGKGWASGKNVEAILVNSGRFLTKHVTNNPVIAHLLGMVVEKLAMDPARRQMERVGEMRPATG